MIFFNSFKIKNYILYKDPIPDDLKSSLVYRLTCACCSSNYIGETYRHCKTRIQEQKKHSTTTCFGSYYYISFKILMKLTVNWT